MRLFITLVITLLTFNQVQAKDTAASIMGRLPVQDGGRIKPYDTFARESLQLIYGRRDFKGKDATEIIMTWLLLPEHWNGIEFVRIERKELKDALQLPGERSLFTPREVIDNERFSVLMQELTTKRESGEKLNPYFQAVQTLENQLGLYRAIVSGDALRFVPAPNSKTWQTLPQLDPVIREKFEAMAKAFVRKLEEPGSTDLELAVKEFENVARAQNAAEYDLENLMKAEIIYNQYHPFLISWVLYTIAALLFLAHWLSRSQWTWSAGWVITILSLLVHTIGFWLRIYITGRPPVSNMYESVVWVSWGTILFAMILEAWKRTRHFMFPACIVAALSLIVADIAPTVLDPTLQPLQPVLRSNMWLVVHVLTITLSYSALFLAFAMGDIALCYYLAGEEKYKDILLSLNMGMYRSIQIGVVLLFAGTILGGVWADYSWGRFWGWDPKETWAFIALMGYLAVLHGRLSGWLKPFGFAVSSVVAFSLVIMAWYGVNFVLGAGLHSYGFGAGGVEYVTAFVLLHLAFCGFVITMRQQRIKN